MGRGGMGVVYRATQLALERSVALKVVSPDVADNPEFRERFKRESRIAGSLEHPNIVPVYEADDVDGVLFIAMRYIQGTDLQALVRDGGPLDPQRAASLVSSVSSALDEAHERGLVHRDVKPANILVERRRGEDHVYLTDFGLTKQMTASGSLTAPGAFVGTTDYAAPEQFQGEPSDARTDVYSLGCVFYLALTGQVPFPSETEAAKVYSHLHREPPRPSDLRSDVPPAVDRVVMTALAKDRGDRYQSAAEFGRAALGAAHSRETAQAAGVTRRAAAPAPVTVRQHRRQDISGATTRRMAPSRRRVILLAAAALVVLAAAAGLLLAGGSDEEGRSVSPASVSDKPIAVGDKPAAAVVGGGALWVANSGAATVTRIDTRSKQPVATVKVGEEPGGVAVSSDAVWVANCGDDTVTRIDPTSNRKVKTIPVRACPSDISATEDAVWVAHSGDNSVTEIEPRSNKLVGKPIKVGDHPSDIAAGGGAVWTTNLADNTVSRIDPRSRAVESIPVPDGPESVSVGDGSVWVASNRADVVRRIDPTSRQVVAAPIPTRQHPEDVLAAGGAVWVANADDDTVTQIDARTSEAVGDPIPVGDSPVSLAADGSVIWVANFRDDSVVRLTRTR